MVADTIARYFEAWQADFASITQRARRRFETADWHGGRTDARERLDLYARFVSAAVEAVTIPGSSDNWADAKSEYAEWLAGRPDWEIGETFFNSVVRRVRPMAGVDRALHFVAPAYERPPRRPPRELFHRYDEAATTAELVGEILTDYRFLALYHDLEADAGSVAAAIDRRIDAPVRDAEIVRPVFYRGRNAYVVGLLNTAAGSIPLVICLRNEDGVAVDAVLVEEDDVSILFSFTRSYFQVETARPYELVRFLSRLMPRKRLSELYATIGYNKHAKTELYRELEDFLDSSGGEFTEAPGTRGLVMLVFTMPGLDLVFKVLRDRFGAPKRVSHRHVRDRYSFVFTHDRAGRLIDAREFLGLALPADRFSEHLLGILGSDCSESIEIGDEIVELKHVYVERRVSPLDLYIRERPRAEARRAVIDYGHAIRDLAATDLFPGDLLLKNFGVTRHGRVVFYDYDELTTITSCRFRALPAQVAETGEIDFGVGDDDIFPEELASFLGLPPALREVFLDHHGDLLEPRYWNEIKERLTDGELIEVTPYRPQVRLRYT